MPKVLCTLPNASEEISGVKFASHANGMVSEEISDEVAATFASIPGYEIVGAAPAGGDDKGDAEKAALLARAEAIQFKPKANWGIDRLRNEVEAAEKAAAGAAAAAAGAGADTGEGEK